MINLKAKDFFVKASYWKSFVIKITSFILFLYTFFSFIIFMNSNVDYYALNLVIYFVIFTFLYIFNNIFNFWLFKKCYSLMMKEVYQIQKEVNLPSKLPKVVYVYTTHNDFWEARMLQNMQQTYQNIEYWISDGSSNKEKIKEIKAFCKKYNVNYHSLKRPSVNKADNLNHFLKYAKVNFDYLLIGDADVIIDKNFVSTSCTTRTPFGLRTGILAEHANEMYASSFAGTNFLLRSRSAFNCVISFCFNLLLVNTIVLFLTPAEVESKRSYSTPLTVKPLFALS